MSWLARLDVDSQTIYSKGVSADIYSWHKMLWQCYPGVPEKTRVDIGFLTRIDQLEGAYRLWVMAKQKPMRPHWCPPDSFAIKEISHSFLSHRYYAFDLRVNPVKTFVRRGPEGETMHKKAPNGDILLRSNGKPKRVQGKRIPIVKHAELHAWLVRKGEVRCRDKVTGENVPGGFRIVDEECLEISPMAESHFRKGKHSAYHGGVQFKGILEVTDQKNFAETYYAGVGSAKGFGFGLLLLAPVKI